MQRKVRNPPLLLFIVFLKNSDDSTFSGDPGVKIRNASGGAHSLLNTTARRLRARSTASSSTTDGDEFSGLQGR